MDCMTSVPNILSWAEGARNQRNGDDDITPTRLGLGLEKGGDVGWHSYRMSSVQFKVGDSRSTV